MITLESPLDVPRMNKDSPLWLVKLRTFSHFMSALGFIQFKIHQSFLPSLVESFYTFVSWYSTKTQDIPTLHVPGALFLHSSLLPKILPYYRLPKLQPPSHQLSKAARICLDLQSRNCFQAESQGNYQAHYGSLLSRITVLCRLLSNV